MLHDLQNFKLCPSSVNEKKLYTRYPIVARARPKVAKSCAIQEKSSNVPCLSDSLGFLIELGEELGEPLGIVQGTRSLRNDT